MTTPNLLPCPFCGADDVEYTDERGDEGLSSAVFCLMCFCEGPVIGYCNERDASVAWNRRNERAASIARNSRKVKRVLTKKNRTR